MMGDLFSELDLNLDLGVNESNDDLDFLPDDLFNFIDDDLNEDLKAIAENDVIPNIESLINFDEDDLVDDIQWNDDLDTTDFFKNIQSQQTTNTNNNISNESTYNQQLNNITNQNSQMMFISPTSSTTTSSFKNSSTITSNVDYSSIENSSSSSNDSSDFLYMFQDYFSLDSNNNLVSHPISNLSIDEINKLNDMYKQQQYDRQFTLSNNFGGFVNVQSALSLMNGLTTNQATTINKQLIKQRKRLSKGTSLLANKPKSYKTIKKEMLQKKTSQSSFTNKLLTKTIALKSAKVTPSTTITTTAKTETTSIQIVQTKSKLTSLQTTGDIVKQSLQPQITITKSTYAQDHDYCFNALDSSSHV